MRTLREGIVSASELWQMYEECLATHTRLGIDDDTVRAHRFFEGDQWHGLESGSEELPVYNFIAPIVRYKTAMIAMNNLCINFSAPVSDMHMQRVCAGLSKLAAQYWEQTDMDTKCWESVKNALIAGDNYLYIYDGDCNSQMIDRTDIFFGDESQPDIAKQPYIIIRERRQVEEVRRDAVANGVSGEVAMTILADDETDDDGKNKCTCLLMMRLVDGNLCFRRTTRTVEYQPEKIVPGLDCYPVVSLISGRRRGTARGRGEVCPIIPNQIEVNRNLARRLLNAKLTAYSRLVFAGGRISNPSALTQVGTAIEVEGGGVGSIKDAVDYLTPSSMSPDAKTLSDELLSVTKELSGAGDAALGLIDPTQASGAAIIAVRDQASLPLNEQTAAYRRFAENIARIWYRLWCVYNPDGLSLPDGEYVSRRELELLEPDVRVDISNANPFSKFAREQAVENLFSLGHISFEEYVSALDDDGAAPKSKLEQIIKNRGGNTYVGR